MEEPKLRDLNVVRVLKADLVDAVQENRDDHRDTFLKAQEGFKKQVIEVLDQKLQAARDGRHIDLSIRLPEPEDHTSDYDRVLRMLDMSRDGELEISGDDFERFVMDNWSWKANWRSTTSRYT